MQLGHRSLLIGVFFLLVLSGCGSSSTGSTTGTASVTTGGTGSTGSSGPGKAGSGGSGGLTGTNDSVVATSSVAGTVSVVAGASQTISVTFTSSDGLAISGFAISGTTLPTGWSGQSPFGCALVSTGSGCVLNLTFAPTTVGSGTLTIDCEFVDNANVARTPGACLTIAYAATPNNNVTATVSPTGQVIAAVGTGNQSVSVNFTTDDGNAATDLTLTTSLSGLPSGWSSTATSLSCAIVSTGSGCQLGLTYAPSAAGSGTLTLDYSYTDGSGAQRTGSLNIPYSTVSSNNVIATASPADQINAVQNTAGQAVAVTFTTDDGKPATNLHLTLGLPALPPGWSSTSGSFSCSRVSTGNGCQLHLTYAPTALASGTLTLSYAYADDTGTARAGLLNVAYAATTNDDVVGTAAPSGQVNAVVGSGSQPVSVTFTTDDGRPATALQLTSSLTALPAGWSSTATSFACSGLSSGNGCQLPLTYAPGAAGSGTLILNYAYENNAGEPKTGSVNIPYWATTNDNIINTPSTSSLAVTIGSNTPVTVIFTTDDGNPATGLSLISSLSTLPSGWTSTSSSLPCSTVSTGTGCQLSLAYAPTAAIANGMLSLNYSYADDSGTPKTGSVNISYVASPPPHLYVAQLGGSLSFCSLNADGTLSSCAVAATGFSAPTGIAFYGANFAYVADFGNNVVDLCNVALDGSLSGCAATGTGFQSPWQLAVYGNTLYATNANSTSGVTVCTIAGDGTLSACSPSAGSGTTGVAADSSYAYIGVAANTVNVCAVGASGSLSGSCASTSAGISTGAVFSTANGISLAGGYAYIANQGDGTVSACAINPDGTFSGCAPSSVGVGVGVVPTDVVINGSQAYVDDASGNIYLCAVGAGGALTNCAVSNGGASFNLGIQIAIH
jgi:hypothetical protein